MRRAIKDTIDLTREEAILIKHYMPNMFEGIENEYKEFKAEYDADESKMQVLKNHSQILEKLYWKINKTLDKK